jgi:sugar lactone lactonase YvrE
MRDTLEKMKQPLSKYALSAVALISMGVSAYAAQPITEITLPGTRVFPESITSTADGTLIVGSLGHGNVSRIAPGTAMVEEWIKPGTGGLNQVLGVYADEKSKTLWVCSNNLDKQGEATAAMSFDLKTGAVKGTYRLPGDGTLCNDIAVASNGTTYVTDTRQGSVVMLRPGSKDLEIAAKDPLLAGADGLAFGEKNVLYVNSVTAGKLLRVELGPDGKSKSVVELKLSRPIERPDGMRAIGKNRLLLAENSGKMDIVTFEGPGLQSAVITTLKEGLIMTPAVTATRGMAWIVEGKLPYRNDAEYKDKDPGMFKMYAVPLPKN